MSSPTSYFLFRITVRIGIVATGGKAAPCGDLPKPTVPPAFLSCLPNSIPPKYLKNRHLIARDGGFLIVVLSVDDR